MLKIPKSRLLFIVIISLIICSANAYAGTSSPFNPPTEDLGIYVINDGSYLDTGCTYRSGGPLRIKLKVPSVVNDNEVGSDGKLINPQKLINSGLISNSVVIRFPVYDIDSSAYTGGSFAPEIDKVYFNGIYKKDLSGINGTWTDDSLIVPISDLKFISTNSPSAENELRIDIDSGNIGRGEYWCMAVDWVSAEFSAALPYVLVHGISAQADSWDNGSAPGFLSALDSKGVLYERVSLNANGSTVQNAGLLRTLITNFLNRTKSKKVHIIAHSKGGLDTQQMAALGTDFKVRSLSTLSTPHLGSVAADLSIVQKTEADNKVNTGADPNGFAKQYVETWTFGQGPQLPGLNDLTTSAASTALNLGSRGNISPTYTTGANADLNNNNSLEVNESNGLFPGAVHYAAERAWRVLRDFSAVTNVSVNTQKGFFGTKTTLSYETVPTQGPLANDIVVTINSANPTYGQLFGTGNLMANHSTVKNATNANSILNTTIPLR